MVCLKGCQVRMLSSFEMTHVPDLQFIFVQSRYNFHAVTKWYELFCKINNWKKIFLQQHKNIFTHVHVYGKPTTPVPLPFLLSRTQGGGGGSLWSH